MSIRSRYPLTYRYWQRESHPLRVLMRALALLAVLFMIGAGWLIYHDLTLALPSVEQLSRYMTPSSTRVYAYDPNAPQPSDQKNTKKSPIGEFYLEKRYPLAFDRIPLQVQHAFLAAEDAEFYFHPGVNPLGMARAFLTNWRAGRKLQGGSTITQQVVKSLLLTSEKSYRRKIQEIILSLRLERYLSKREIFELYLNQIYLGSGAYGIAAAAREYFAKSVDELSLAETAMIAGLTPAPSRYSPMKNWQRAKARQRYVLERMVDEGYISSDEQMAAWQAETPLATPAARQETISAAPYFVEHVRQFLQQRYGGQTMQQLGFEVHTTVDLQLQDAAERAVRAGIDALCERQQCGRNGVPRPEGALLAIEIPSGHVKALVGGEDFQRSQFNRATQAKRQPGSAFKPFIYAAALEGIRGLTLASIINDAPVSFQDNGRVWSPQNYERRYFGPTRVREALTFSRNVVTVKLAAQLGLGPLASYLTRFGLHSRMARHLSVALGSAEVTLEELTRAYGVFVSGGFYFEPLYITKITDNFGNVLYEFTRTDNKALSSAHAYLMTSMMQDVIARGTGKAASVLGRPAAGKTGTSNDFRDAWFIGYTPELLVGVWVGYDEKRPLGEKETGGRAAAPIWLAFMRQALGDAPVHDFELPKEIVLAPIDPRTGERALPGSSSFILERFRPGTGPNQRTDATALSSGEPAATPSDAAAQAEAEGF